MGLLSNFVSLLSSSQKGFFSVYKSNIYGTNQPVWIDTDSPYKLYYEHAELKTCIDKIAKMFSNMEILLVDDEGNELTNDELMEMLQNPNALQSLNEFLEYYIIQKYVYGNQFIYKSQPSKLSYKNTLLLSISAENIQPVISGKIYEQKNIRDIIKRYELLENGRKVKDLKTDEVLWSKFADIDNPLMGVSPLKTLKFQLTNTKLAYEHRNVIMKNKGAIGMITNESGTSNGMGFTPVTPEEQSKIAKDYEDNYGVEDGKKKIIISNKPLRWQPMSYPTRDLLLFEEIEANKLAMIDYFGLKAELFSTKSNTYENVRQAIRGTYQDLIYPIADEFCQALTSFLKVPNGKLIASYKHVPILQEQKDYKSIVDSINSAVTNGLLDVEVGRTIIEQETQALNNT